MAHGRCHINPLKLWSIMERTGAYDAVQPLLR